MQVEIIISCTLFLPKQETTCVIPVHSSACWVQTQIVARLLARTFFKHTLTWTMVSIILNSLFGEVLTCPHNCYESAVYDMLTSLFRNLIPKLSELGKICQINTIDITA